MSFFINGQFWQEDEAPQEAVGQLVIIPRSTKILFHGFFGPGKIISLQDNHVGGYTQGYIYDKFGKSSITDFILDEDVLMFTKKHDHEGSTPVSYRLVRSIENEITNDIFVGEWKILTQGIVTVSGRARCILTSIPAHFFKKPS